MIDKNTYTKEHILHLVNKHKTDPQLLERAIFALGLLEALSKVSKDFCFKGGSSLMILIDKPRRLSTDIDIIVDPDFNIKNLVEEAAKIYPFLSYEESVRKTNKNISKKHFRFNYQSILREGKETQILLDVLFEKSPYDLTIKTPIKNEMLINIGEYNYVYTPTVEALLGDKLTAFAPHTVGIKFHNEDFSNDKRLEVVKQLLDISLLFNISHDFKSVKNNYISVCNEEIKYRDLDITYKDCLLDSFNTALSIVSRGAYNRDDYHLLVEGITAVTNHVYGERYSSEKAVDDASNVILLVAGILTNTDIMNIDINEQSLIKNANYNKINFQKKNRPNAYNKCAYAISLMLEKEIIF